jgi:hypothetical protein
MLDKIYLNFSRQTFVKDQSYFQILILTLNSDSTKRENVTVFFERRCVSWRIAIYNDKNTLLRIKLIIIFLKIQILKVF